MSTDIKTHPGQIPGFERITARLINRTGATLTPGQTVALDLTGSDGDVQAYSAYSAASHNSSQHPFRNVITLGAAHDDGWINAVALETIADNAEGEFGIQGVFDVNIATGVAIGARLAPSSATATSLVAEADGLAICAVALEANSSGAIAARPCIFQGNTLFGPQAEI